MKFFRNHKKANRMQPGIEEALSRMSQWRVPEKHTREQLWAGIATRIEDGQRRGKVLPFRSAIVKTAAAAAVVFLGLLIAWISTNKTFTAKPGQLKQVYLPDSSHVMLNAGTELHYNRIAWFFSRRVKLKGEAWFEVNKGRKFRVEAPQGRVQVLGTSFNVYARGSDFRTHCFTGKVAVSTNGRNVVLHPGEAATVNAHKLTRYRFDMQQAPNSWQYGRLHYKNASLARIADELERQFAVEIKLQTPKNRHYTGSFTLQNLDSALKNICKPMGLSYKKRNQLIIVK